MKTTTDILDRDTRNKTLNLGFVGLGWIGRNRMERLMEHPAVTCSAIVEPNGDNANAVLQASDKIELKLSMGQLVADPALDGIVIATPSAMHAQQAIAALNAGKAVFCQKPLGRNFQEVQEVIEASLQHNKLLSVDLSYRYTRAFEAVYRTIKNGEIGKVYAVNLTFHNAYGPDKDWFYDMKQSGGGCVLDLGIHLLDLALWSLNFPEIDNVQSSLFQQGRKLESGEQVVEDYASATLNTSDGVVINLQCSWNISAGKEAEIAATFYGTEGGVAFKNRNGSFYDFTAEKYEGTQTEILVSPPDNWGGKAGLVWADAVLEGKGYAAVDAEEQLQLAKIIDRIYGR